MAVIFFQMVVAGTIFVTYKIALLVGTSRPLRPPAIVAMIWGVFTIFAVFALPLLLIQLAFAGGTLYFCYQKEQQKEKIASQSAEIERLKNKLREGMSGFSTDLQRDVEQQISKGSYEIVVGSDHARQLYRALARAQHRLIILSGWVRSSVVNQHFEKQLEVALQRGVDVTIGYGWQGITPSERSQAERDGEQRLTYLRERAENFGWGHLKILDFSNHAKILLVDHEFAIISSHNWLSNSRAQNTEISLLTRDQGVMDSLAHAVWQELNTRYKPLHIKGYTISLM